MVRFRQIRRKTLRPKKPAVSQLGFFEAGGTAERGRPDLDPTTVLRRHRSCARVLGMIRQVRAFFPELDGIAIRVGLTRCAAGLASREDPWIWVNPRKLTRHTIAHEFVHLVQTQGLLPSGEKSADLHALARHSFLVDDLPFYLRLPRPVRLAWTRHPERVNSFLHGLACEALQRREEGHRTYLRWFEREAERRWLADPHPPSAGPVRADGVEQFGLFG